MSESQTLGWLLHSFFEDYLRCQKGGGRQRSAATEMH